MTEAATDNGTDTDVHAATRGPRIDAIETRVYTIPTEEPESDGTLEWDHTTIVVVLATSGDTTGAGYAPAHAAAASIIDRTLAPALHHANALSPQAAHHTMRRGIRNQGEQGLAMMALSAVDSAIWDLKARLLDLPLATLLGGVRTRVPVYASGGFTSYTVAQLRRQLAGWIDEGHTRVKMKVGRNPLRDPARVDAARDAIGPDAELFIDANGAYDEAQALALADRFCDAGVTWFEEPRPSADLASLRHLRDRLPPGMQLAAGEYAATPATFAALAESVHVLQADASRCGGITGLLSIAGLCESLHRPLSLHCCPALHAHPACALLPLVHLEDFHDHTRTDALLFDGLPERHGPNLAPDFTRPGNGLTLKPDTDRYRV